MDDSIKIIEIPNFLKIKLVKINNVFSVYYVENYNNAYFYPDIYDFLKSHKKGELWWKFHLSLPHTIKNIKIEELEEYIYELYRTLKQTTISRAEFKQNYYIIDSDFSIRKLTELNYNFDYRHHSVQNYFLIESQAREFASKLKGALIDLWEEELKK